MVDIIMLMTKELVGELQLFTCSFLFGISFTVQRYAMLGDNHIKPLTYTAFRFLASTILLISLRSYLKMIEAKEEVVNDKHLDKVQEVNKTNNNTNNNLLLLLFYGFICGIMNYGGSAFQQSSLEYISAGKVGFITGSYVVIIPFIEFLIPIYSKHLNSWTWIAAFMNLIGLFLLSGCAESDVCISGSLGKGEQFVLISVIFWVVSIMVADAAVKQCDVVDL